MTIDTLHTKPLDILPEFDTEAAALYLESLDAALRQTRTSVSEVDKLLARETPSAEANRPSANQRKTDALNALRMVTGDEAAYKALLLRTHTNDELYNMTPSHHIGPASIKQEIYRRMTESANRKKLPALEAFYMSLGTLSGAFDASFQRATGGTTSETGPTDKLSAFDSAVCGVISDEVSTLADRLEHAC